MKRILLLAFVFFPFLGFSQESNFKIGDKFVATFYFYLENVPAWRNNSLEKDYGYNQIWTLKNTGNSYTHNYTFVNKKDSFSTTKEQLIKEIADKKIFTLSDFKNLEKAFKRPIFMRLFDRDVWIGMTDDQAEFVLGRADDTNTTRTKYGTSEQWVYKRYKTEYYYFTNGILTSIQN